MTNNVQNPHPQYNVGEGFARCDILRQIIAARIPKFSNKRKEIVLLSRNAVIDRGLSKEGSSWIMSFMARSCP